MELGQIPPEEFKAYGPVSTVSRKKSCKNPGGLQLVTLDVEGKDEMPGIHGSIFETNQSRSTGRFETLQPTSMPPIGSTKTKSRVIESFGLKSSETRKSECSAGGMVNRRGKQFHRKRAKEMIKAIKNEQKEKKR